MLNPRRGRRVWQIIAALDKEMTTETVTGASPGKGWCLLSSQHAGQVERHSRSFL